MKKFYRKNDMKDWIKNLDSKPKLLIYYLEGVNKNRFTGFNNHNDLFKNIKTFTVNNNYYINEIVTKDVQRKPYIDLEKVYPDKATYDDQYKNIIKKLQKDIINVFKSAYNENITVEDILLLTSSGKVDTGFKMSYHIIVSPVNRTLYYTNSATTNSSAIHLYTSLINLDETYKEFLDGSVYNEELNLRILGSAKNFSDNKRILKPVDVKTLMPIEKSDKEKLNYFITYINPSKEKKQLQTPVIEQTTKVKKNIVRNRITKTNVNTTLMSYVKKYHPTAEHKGLYQDIYHRFIYTNRKEVCPISGKIHSGTNGFYVIENERGYYLKCHSNHCTGKIHIGYADRADDFIDNAYQINQQYLLNGEINKKPNEKVKEWILDWLNNDEIKTLAVKSSMGTGKTTMVHTIFQYHKPFKKILWITYRQTLTKQIFGSFKKYGFVNYLDEEGCLFNHDRIIVQVDSLMRIMKYDYGNILLKQYDLVVIDENEGCMNHYSSPFLEKPEHSARDKFNIMSECIDSAKKLLVLDADIGMRTKLFIDNFGKSIVINNKYKPQKKIFTVTNDEETYYKQMFDDIKNKKNICVVSMSAGALEEIITKLKNGVKYVMHTSKTDDKLKDELEDVNNFWIKYQCVLYSPTIESGVDFNAEHFDKIYCILLNGQMTTSQRGFLQMVGRIRKIKDNNILCLYKYDSISTNSLIYTFDDVLSHFRYYEDINGKKMMHNIEYQKVVKDGEIKLTRVTKDISLFDKIMLYNEVEQLNKHQTTFMTVLNKLIQRGGHELKFMMITKKIKKQKKDGENDKITIKDKLIEIDLTKYDIKALLKKQSKSQLDETEKMVLKKYFFLKVFGVSNASDKKEFKIFVNEYFGKEISVYRYEKLFCYKTKDTDTEYDNFNDGKEKVRHKIIFDLVNRLIGKEYDKYNAEELNDIVIDNVQYEKAIDDIAKNSLYFVNEKKNRPLFFKKKGNYATINKNNKQYYVKTVMALLESYNIFLRRGKRKRVKGNLEYEYSLSVDEQIKNIIEYKHGEANKVKGYPTIFNKK